MGNSIFARSNTNAGYDTTRQFMFESSDPSNKTKKEALIYEKKKKLFTKMTTVVMTAIIAMLSATVLAGCGCSDKRFKTVKATEDEVSVEPFVPETVETLNETDQAIVDAGLTVDDSGNITDAAGNKVEVAEDGKVEVKTADGKTVKVDANGVKTANQNKTAVEQANAAAAEEQRAAYEAANNNGDNGNNTNNNGGGNTNNNNQTSKPAQTSQTSKPSSNNGNSGNNQTSKPSQNPQPATQADPHAGKTWHEAQYKTINHPAETKQVWVVDVPAHEETVTTTEKRHYIRICAGCGAIMDSWSDDQLADHVMEHYRNGEANGWGSGYVDEPVTKTVYVEEQGHYETQVVKEAWTEKVLVKEAGWY